MTKEDEATREKTPETESEFESPLSQNYPRSPIGSKMAAARGARDPAFKCGRVRRGSVFLALDSLNRRTVLL